MTNSLMSYLSEPARESLLREKIERLKRPLVPTTAPDPIDWIQANFYLYDTGELMQLYPCQVDALRAAFTRDSEGHYQYTTILWSWPKKSAKSTVIAAVVDYIAEHQPRASIKLIANDLKQADSRVGMYLRENIRIAQRKGQRQDIKITPSGYKIDYPSGAHVEMIPIDPSGEAGGNDDLIVYSELWGWKHTAHQRMWSEMTLSPTKFGRSQRWIDTYAGFTGESPVLEALYETGVRHGRELWPGSEVYANDAAKMLSTWVTGPRFPWQTPAYYAEQAATLTPNEFRRMHKNEWVSSEDTFIPIEWWDACKVDSLPPLNEYAWYAAGVDAAVSNDCFGIVAISRHGDKFAVRYVRKWSPPRGGTIDFAEPESEIRRLAQSAADGSPFVSVFYYDRHQLHDMATRLKQSSIWMREFDQGEARLLADKGLYDLIRERRILHTGDPDLREHIMNANAKTDNEKLRIIKRADHLKIDLAVCLSMVCQGARLLNMEGVS